MQFIDEEILVSKMKEYIVREGKQFTYSNLKEEEVKIEADSEKEKLIIEAK